ncbi:Sfi1 spindle body domain-containing protein [Trichoderma chlorosporum]
MASVQSSYDNGTGPDSVRVSPSRVLPGKEPYYSNRDIAVLHAIIAAAQEKLDSATGPKPLPAAALFSAYDEVLPQHGVDPDSDHHLSAFVFRVSGEEGGGSLLDKFQSILGRIGIVLEFSDDSLTSPQGYYEHPLSPNPIDTDHWYPDDLPINDDDDIPHIRPRASSATSLENVSSPKNRSQEPSKKKNKLGKDGLDHVGVKTEVQPSAQISTTATRHLDPYHHYPSPLFDHLPLDLRAVGVGTPDDDAKIRLLASQTDTSHHSLKQNSKRNNSALGVDDLPGSIKHQDQQSGDAGDDESKGQPAVLQDNRNYAAKTTQTDQDKGKDDDVNMPRSPEYIFKDPQPALHSLRDGPPLAFSSQNETTLSRQNQDQLLTRATRAREIYLASKVFNHWADRTAARLEREGVARRHMIRFRCFQGWSCAPSLRLPVIDQLKALTAVQKLQRAVSYQEEQLNLAASAIFQSYRARTASRVYDQWCSHLISLDCRRKMNKKSKQSALLAWKSSTSSNLIKSQAIRRFNKREGVITTLSKLQDHAILNSRQFHTARQIGSLQLLFGYLTEWRDQVQVKSRSSAYCARASVTTISRTFQNWNLLVRVQAFRWRADFISVTRALESWRRHYIREEWRRSTATTHLKSCRVLNALRILQRSSSLEAQRSHLSSRARLFIVTTQILPIMDSAVEIRKAQMKEIIRRYLMMRYTQVSSARKKRNFYEAFDHWRAVTAQAISDNDVVILYNSKYYYGQLDLALTKWNRQAEEDLEIQLTTYKHYVEAMLTTWADAANEQERMDIQSVNIWATRRQRQHLKAWSISSLQRSGQAHTATKVLQKSYSEKRNRTFQHWRQSCAGTDVVRSEHDQLRFTPKSELPSGRRGGWRTLSARRHLLTERHNKQDSATKPIETPTRWTGIPLNMSFPLSAKPLASWRETDEESATSSDTEDAGLLKSPSKPPSNNTGRITLPSTTPRGPVPVHLNIKARKTESSPHRRNSDDTTPKPKANQTQDTPRASQPTPNLNFSRSFGAFGRSIQAPLSSPNGRSAISYKQVKGASLQSAERGLRAEPLYDAFPADKQSPSKKETGISSFQIS